jgi:hypothetical protein
MFPNPLDYYNAGLKWALPSLLVAVFFYHFISSYFSARVHQQWLDRLQARDKAAQCPHELSPADRLARVGIIERCMQLLLIFREDT